jgi:hypothetical protein
MMDEDANRLRALGLIVVNFQALEFVITGLIKDLLETDGRISSTASVPAR